MKDIFNTNNDSQSFKYFSSVYVQLVVCNFHLCKINWRIQDGTISIANQVAIDNSIQLRVSRWGIPMLTSAQSDLAPRGNQRRPLSAPLAGWVCECANGSVKFPAYCRRVRFRVGWCRTTTVGPCTGQRVNSAEKREIVDIVVAGAIDCRIGTGASLMGCGGWRLVPRRRRDADDVPRYRRAHTPSTLFPHFVWRDRD